MSTFTFRREGLKYHPVEPVSDISSLIRRTLILDPDNSKFAGYVAPVKFYSKDFSIGVGLLPAIEKKCQTTGTDIKIIGKKLNDASFIPTELNPILRPHQRDAVISFAANSIGIIKIPTRGGKTFVAGECIAQVLKRDPKAKILFFVDSTSLLSQTVTELGKYLKLPIGKIQGATYNPKTVTVASIQSIASILSKEKKHLRYNQFIKYSESVNFLIIDEIHEFGSELRADIIFSFKNIEYLLGLSATPFRSNGQVPKTRIQSYARGVCYEVAEEGLIDKGVLVENKTLLLKYCASKDHRKVDDIGLTPIERYNERRKVLVYENKERNALIAYLVKQLEAKGLQTVVMTNNIAHGKAISKLVNVSFISGTDSDEQRQRITKSFLTGKTKTLLVSEIYKKGITLPEAQVFINVSGGKETSLIMQKRGRVLGASKGKDRALLIDIYDFNAWNLTTHADERVKQYEKIGVTETLSTASGFGGSFNTYIDSWFN